MIIAKQVTEWSLKGYIKYRFTAASFQCNQTGWYRYSESHSLHSPYGALQKYLFLNHHFTFLILPKKKMAKNLRQLSYVIFEFEKCKNILHIQLHNTTLFVYKLIFSKCNSMDTSSLFHIEGKKNIITHSAMWQGFQ